jgi:hypothetical protein
MKIVAKRRWSAARLHASRQSQRAPGNPHRTVSGSTGQKCTTKANVFAPVSISIRGVIGVRLRVEKCAIN